MGDEHSEVLRKEKFLQGVRQKWTGILLCYSLIIAFFQIKFGLDPTPYINFGLTIGSLFILGGSVDSFMKLNTAYKIQSNGNGNGNGNGST